MISTQYSLSLFLYMNNVYSSDETSHVSSDWVSCSNFLTVAWIFNGILLQYVLLCHSYEILHL